MRIPEFRHPLEVWLFFCTNPNTCLFYLFSSNNDNDLFMNKTNKKMLKIIYYASENPSLDTLEQQKKSEQEQLIVSIHDDNGETLEHSVSGNVQSAFSEDEGEPEEDVKGASMFEEKKEMDTLQNSANTSGLLPMKANSRIVHYTKFYNDVINDRSRVFVEKDFINWLKGRPYLSFFSYPFVLDAAMKA